MSINRKDYLYHFIAGYVIAMIFYISSFPFLSLIVATVAAIGKEVYDKISKKGDADIVDALCTIAGGIVGMLVEIIKN